MSIPVAPARPTIMINVDPSRMMSGRDWEEGMQRYAQTPQGGTNPYAAQAALLRYALTPRGEESNEIGGEGGKSLFERIMELGKTGEERQRKLVEFFRNEEPGGGRVYGG